MDRIVQVDAPKELNRLGKGTYRVTFEDQYGNHYVSCMSVSRYKFTVFKQQLIHRGYDEQDLDRLCDLYHQTSVDDD